MNKTRLILIAILILVSFSAYAGKGADKKDKKGLEHRVTALEESPEFEFLLRWDGSAGSPDCGLFYHYETPLVDTPVYIGQGKDTFPPSFSGDYRGDLTAIVIRVPQDLPVPPATSDTDILAIRRGGDALLTSQNAADLGYGAVLIVNNADVDPILTAQVTDDPENQKAGSALSSPEGIGVYEPSNPQAGSRLPSPEDNGFVGTKNLKAVSRLSSPDGITPFPIPTMMVSGFETFFYLNAALLEYGRVPIFIEGTTFCSSLSASSFPTK